MTKPSKIALTLLFLLIVWVVLFLALFIFARKSEDDEDIVWVDKTELVSDTEIHEITIKKENELAGRDAMMADKALGRLSIEKWAEVWGYEIVGENGLGYDVVKKAKWEGENRAFLERMKRMHPLGMKEDQHAHKEP